MDNQFEFEILEDGTIKTTSGKFGAVYHKSAEDALAYLARLMGGSSTRTRRGDAHVHQHGEHSHSHEHGHDH